MSHVVMQAAQAASIADAQRIEGVLRELVADYATWERAHPAPWDAATIPDPLVAFGERHGVAWPNTRSEKFLIKGTFPEDVHVLRVDRLVFFWGGGHDLGGEWLRSVLTKLGAVATTSQPHLRVPCATPDVRIRELTDFLEEEDYERQFRVDPKRRVSPAVGFSIALESATGRRLLSFDDSGIQDWAFVRLLPQLDGEDPTLVV